MIPKPTPNYVIAERHQAVRKTQSGIYLPEAQQQKSALATVRAVGSDVIGVAVGDQLIFGEFAATEIAVGGQTYLVLKGEDILAVM